MEPRLCLPELGKGAELLSEGPRPDGKLPFPGLLGEKTPVSHKQDPRKEAGTEAMRRRFPARREAQPGPEDPPCPPVPGAAGRGLPFFITAL